MVGTVQAKAERQSLSSVDSALIFSTGVALQAGSLSLHHHFRKATPVAYLGVLGSGLVMSRVGDHLGYNGRLLWTVSGTLSGTSLAGGIGWMTSWQWHRDPPNNLEEYLGSAALVSMGPLMGTLAYVWSNAQDDNASISVSPTTIPAPKGKEVRGIQVAGRF